ncbi:MAG: hypothetical protein IJ509_01890 [Bacilli bacterium]|nr:hypothetical protein [Bacilli bacterium]
MKNKPSITYWKNGREKTITNKFQYLIDKHNIFKIILSDNDVLKDVELIHIKNLTFDSAVNFECYNPDTIIILENCTFNGKIIFLQFGNYQLINPKFTNDFEQKIYIIHCGDVEIKANKDTNISYLEVRDTTTITLAAINKVKKLVSQTNITRLIDINNLQEYDIQSTNLEIENCSFKFKNLSYNKITTDNFKVKNSNLSIYGNCLPFENIELDNSNIQFKYFNLEEILKFESAAELFYLEKDLLLTNLTNLKMKNSSITSNTAIDISPKLEVIELDDTSYLKVNEHIRIGGYKYWNEPKPNQPFILSKNTLENITFKRRILINTLKEVSKQLQLSIEKALAKKEQEEIILLIKEEQKLIDQIRQDRIIKQTNIKKKIKQQEQTNLSKIKIKDINE